MSAVIGDNLEGSEPMRPAELVVAIQMLGCRAEDDSGKALRTVRKSLQGHPGRFVRGRDEGWGCPKS